jgi:hypothetical protein
MKLGSSSPSPLHFVTSSDTTKTQSVILSARERSSEVITATFYQDFRGFHVMEFRFQR